MHEQNAGFDIDRYRQMLVEAVDESKRLALIDLLIQERAMDRLQAHRAGRTSPANQAPRSNIIMT
jgi:hypothetical protein